MAQNSPTRAPGELLVNSQGMKLVYIPAGRFRMGSPPDEKGRQDEEVQHNVGITRSFWIGLTEVTQKQWTEIMGSNRSAHQGDDLPVEKVSWTSALEFCKRLSAKEGRTYRLPTEAEWEYACRSGSAGAFAGTGNIEEMAWYESNSDGETHPVASKKPNAWGLFDMHGNVAEWCNDFYSPTYSNSEEVDPTGPTLGKARVVRGGSYAYFSVSARSAARSSSPESYQLPHLGFRLVMEATP